MKCSLGISNFLEEVSIPSYSLFSTIPLDWSFKKSFLSLLAILCNSPIKWVYLSFSPLLFASLLFTVICKASSDSHLAFLHFFFLGIVLTRVSCIVVRWDEDHIFIRLWNRLDSLKEDGLNVLPGNIFEYDLNFQVSLNNLTPIYLHVRFF